MKLRDSLFLGGALACLAFPAFAQGTLAAFDDGDYVSLTGTVRATSGDEFVLDYGTGQVKVDMNDWNWYGSEADRLKAGERVTVTGKIDDNFFTGREIDADTVYVPTRYTQYYSNGAGTRGYYYSWYEIPQEGNWVSVSGTVTQAEGREFTLDTGANEIRVDTKNMSYDPMDKEGYQIIDPGDRVRVSGVLDNDLFDTRKINATTVVTLYEDRGTQ